MKKIVLIFFTSIFSFSNVINFEGLHSSKKIPFILNDNIRTYTKDLLNIELNQTLINNDNTSGWNLVDIIDEEVEEYGVEIRNTVIANQNTHLFKSKILFNLTRFAEDIPIEFAGLISYINSGFKNSANINGVGGGLEFKIKIPDYNIYGITQHNIEYQNIRYNRYIQDNILVSGGINIKTFFGDSFYISPRLLASYFFSIKNSFKDANNDKIEILPKLSYDLGASIRVGYMYSEDFKLDISIGYMVDKKMNNVGKYRIFTRDLLKEKNDYLGHIIDAILSISFKDYHKLSASIGVNYQENIKGLASLNYSYIF